jgi:transcriptional regulator with XRE-family HTH domain
MGIGKRLKHYRQKAGWTLDDLCEVSGVEPGTISALENRDSNSSMYFLPLAKAFGLSLEQLADEGTDWPIKYEKPGHDPTHNANDRGPKMPYGWPFKRIEPAQYNRLNPRECEILENMIDLFLKDRDDPKQSEPAQTGTSS